MSLIRKEFLNITNLCRMPLILKPSKGNFKKPLRYKHKYIINSLVSQLFWSILSADPVKKSKKKRKKPEPNDDSHEDEESSIIQSAKLQVPSKLGVRSRSSRSTNKSVINRVKQPSIIAIKNSVNDANNNNKTLKVSLTIWWKSKYKVNVMIVCCIPFYFDFGNICWFLPACMHLMHIFGEINIYVNFVM